jgi:hypothetical protein
VGAAVGFVLPEGLVGVVAGNITGSLLGQIAGNVVSGNGPVDHLNYCAAAAAGVGGTAGNLLARTAAGSRLFPIILPVLGSDVSQSSVVYPVTGLLTAVGEAAGSGLSENAVTTP